MGRYWGGSLFGDEENENENEEERTERTYDRGGGSPYSGSGYWGGGWSRWGGRGDDGSFSGWWTRKLGGVRSWFKGGEAGKYAEALRSVQRIGRLIYKRDINFCWTDEGRAHLDDNIVLDPGPLEQVGKLPGWGEGRLVDSLIGDAMSRAGHKKFIVPKLSKRDFRAAILASAQRISNKHDRPNLAGLLREIGDELYNASDWLMAERFVTESFPGYRGYFRTEREFGHRESAGAQEQVNMAFAQDDRHISGIATVALWNVLSEAAGENEDGSRVVEPLEIPDHVSERTREEIAKAEDRLREAGADSPIQLLPRIHDLMEQMADYTFPENDGEGEGGGEEGGESWRDQEGEAAAEQQMAAAAEFGMDSKSGRGEPGERLDAEIAAEADDMADRGYAKDTLGEPEPSGRPGEDYGASGGKVVSMWATADSARYRAVLQSARPHIERTREALAFRNEMYSRDEYRLRRGDVDEGGLHRLAEGKLDVFRRTDIQESPEVSLGILVDQSGSMAGGYGAPMSKIEVARICAALMVEATKGLRGVDVNVWGHSTNLIPHDGRTQTHILRYVEGQRGDPTSLGTIRANSDNYDGYALQWSGEQLVKVSKKDNKVLFILLDGYPCAPGYGGYSADKHVRKVVKYLAARGVEVFAIGTGGDVDNEGLERQYGKDRYILVPEPKDLPRELSKLMTRALRTGHV